MTKRPIAVLISGSGTNLQALIDTCAASDFPARIALVISNKDEAFGLARAQKAGIPTQVIRHKDYPSRETFDAALHEALNASGVELVCLAGFMRLLTPWFVERWKDRLMNIHPSLLPAFPGLRTHESAIAQGVRFAGCTVHFVRAEMDAGPIIIQAAVPVLQDDTPETLGARVLEQEHRCYPQAVKWWAEGRLKMEGERVRAPASHLFRKAVIHPALDA